MISWQASTVVNHPTGLSSALTALWHDKRGAWDAAHDLVQDNTQASCRVHAYLHHREGDPDNAAYWYQRASVPVYAGSTDEEWSALVAELTV